jgi:hypothetical protein
MQLVEVNSNKTRSQFHDVLRELYKNDDVFVCPLDSEIEKIFTPAENPFYRNGEATRWILVDETGKLLGRVAAFYNKERALKFQQPTGNLGFFECIEDKEASVMLFDRCRQWLRERGMEAMDGPANFGENDNYTGVLVEGFIHPSHGMNYNHPYYKELYESYGFEPFFEQVTNHLDLTVPFPERFWKIADWIANRPGFTFEHFRYKETERFINDLVYIYNKAWKDHEHFMPLSKDLVRAELKKAKVILEEEFIWFAYHENEPIAFLLMFPDVNQILKHFDGKMNLWNMLKFIYLKNSKTITRTRITVMGVVPEFQRHGIESGIFRQMDKVMAKKPHYTEIELSWVGDFNPKMEALHKAVGARFAKRHVTYRKLFDQGQHVEKMHRL